MNNPDQRPLGFWRCWGIVVGGTIGSAVFMMPAIMAPYGAMGLISLGAATLGAISIALMFGTLARRVTLTGGAYAYTRAGFGDFAAFLIAWGMWISIWVACAAIAVALAAYVGVLVPAIGASVPLTAGVGLTAIWIAVGINAAGVRESGIVSLATTLLKITPLIVIGFAGLLYGDVHAIPAMPADRGAPIAVFGSVFALSFWNFVGIEGATVPAEEAINPGDTIARATLVGTLTVGAIYLLVSFAALTLAPADALIASSSPLSEVGTRLFGSAGSVIVAVAALVSTAGCLNASVLEAGQTAMAAARDGLFPSVFSRLTARHSPTASYVLAGVLASALLLLNFSKGLVAAFTFMGLISTLTIVIPYAFSAAASLILQRRQPASTRTARWREASVAAMAFAVCMWVIATSGLDIVYWGFLLLMAGLPVYVALTPKKLVAFAARPE